MTLDTCSHVLPTMQRAAAEKLDQLITTAQAQAASKRADRHSFTADSPPPAQRSRMDARPKEIGYR